MSDLPKVEASGNDDDGQIPNPGLLGLELSVVNIHIDELHSDDSLPQEKRHLYLQYYFHQRESLQRQLKTLALRERVVLCEKALAEKESAVAFARSDAGKAKAHERWQRQLTGAALSSGSKNAYEMSRIPNSSEEAEQAYIREFEIERQNAASSLSTVRSELDASILFSKSLDKSEAGWNVHLAAIKEWEGMQDWEQITPEGLRPSVKALRKKFDHHAWQVRRSTEVFCYEALHPQGPSQLKPEDAPKYQKYLVTFLGETGRRLFTSEKSEPPTIFKKYLDAYRAGVNIVVSVIFHELLEIANQHAHVLPTHPIRWAKRHLQMLIRSERSDVKQWIKAVCDHQHPGYSPEDIDESLYWGQWRAPRFVHMQPAGNTSCDPTHSWIREDVERSQMILESQGAHFVALLDVALDRIVDETHIKFAKQKTSIPDDGNGQKTPQMSESAHRDLPRAKGIHIDEPIPISPSDTWRAFHQTFKALGDEELKFEPENRYDRWLRAHVSYEDQSLEYGYWLLGNGLNEGFKERFEVAATRAGITLRPSGMGPRLEIWLHDVFLDLLEHRSKLLFAATRDGGGIITRICEASAIHCARLEKTALETEVRGLGERSQATVHSRMQSAKSPDTRKSGRKPTRSDQFVGLAGRLWLEANRNGNSIVTLEQLAEIASRLDEQSHVPPADYLEGKWARDLKAFNSKNSNSKTGAIQTWSR